MASQPPQVTVEVGDRIINKDGLSLRVLAIFKSGNIIHRVECIDDADTTPTRMTVFRGDIVKLFKKAKPVATVAAKAGPDDHDEDTDDREDEEEGNKEIYPPLGKSLPDVKPGKNKAAKPKAVKAN